MRSKPYLWALTLFSVSWALVAGCWAFTPIERPVRPAAAIVIENSNEQSVDGSVAKSLSKTRILSDGAVIHEKVR